MGWVAGHKKLAVQPQATSFKAAGSTELLLIIGTAQSFTAASGDLDYAGEQADLHRCQAVVTHLPFHAIRPSSAKDACVIVPLYSMVITSSAGVIKPSSIRALRVTTPAGLLGARFTLASCCFF